MSLGTDSRKPPGAPFNQGTRDHAAMNLHSVSDALANSPAQSRWSPGQSSADTATAPFGPDRGDDSDPVRAQEDRRQRARYAVGRSGPTAGGFSGDHIPDTRYSRSKLGRLGLGFV